ncbi:MAG: GNAT family N-acetyltransferase [Sphingobacteriales bacterium]|nr:MAG: GNAT family N-acetyltransferase [Sphingobacteriales bacterium]
MKVERKLKIVRATIADVKEINVLVNSAYRGESSKIGWTTEADLLDGIRVDEERLVDFIQKKDSMLLKYMDDENKIIGCVHLEKHGYKLYLGMLTVSPEFQGRGIGKEMMKEAEVQAKAVNCSAVYMSVITDRRVLLEWYIKHGYKNTGVKKPFPSHDKRFGLPKKPLEFILLEKSIL